MKKLVEMSLFVCAVIFGFNTDAQSNDLRASVAGITGSKAAFGINVGIEYFHTDKISESPSFDYLLETIVIVSGVETLRNKYSINLDGRYYMTEFFYGLVGISLALVKQNINMGGFSFSSTGEIVLGINVGTGAMLIVSDVMMVNIQAKYNTPPLEQIVVQVGVSFLLKNGDN